MKTVCEKNMCAGCMACVEVCPKSAITIKDELKHYNAIIGNSCIDCGACQKVCQNNYPAECIEPQQWYQGWANDNNIRMNGSSGGFAMALAYGFVRNVGTVCSCAFVNGAFVFRFADTETELKKFAGSKYVKSNPQGIYKKVREKLKNGEKILFIGLPCQVSALRNCVGKNLSNGLYTIDLICHGTPSPKVLETFLQQHGYELNELKDVSFRSKGKFRVTGDYKSIAAQGTSDNYMISFLGSLTYTENCYNCQYAKLQRVSDLTLGDSWGSSLPNDEWKRGISLVLCQTDKGKELLEYADMHLEKVDLQNAIERNHQLNHPSVKPGKRNVFFEGLSKGKNFDYLVFQAFPKKCLKQMIKRILIVLKIIPEGDITYRIEIRK